MLGGTSSTRNLHKSTPTLLANQRKATRVVSKKRLGTPIKMKQNFLNTLVDDDEQDATIENLNKEIAELRAKNKNHGSLRNRLIDDEDDEDDLETALLAENFLGELGSSSGSHKDAFEEDYQDILDGDSGASASQSYPIPTP